MEGSRRSTAGAGLLLYTDGLTEARRDGEFIGLDGVSAALGDLRNSSPTEAVAVLSLEVVEHRLGGVAVGAFVLHVAALTPAPISIGQAVLAG